MIIYDLKVGYSCSNSCRHCVISKNASRLKHEGHLIDLDTDQCLSQLKMMQGTVGHIVITGGEPCLRKDFSVILDTCMDYGFGVTIQTNGRHLSSPHILSALKKSPQLTLVIALHGGDSGTHDAITRVNGSFEETLRGIKAVADIGLRISLKTVLSRYNINSLLTIPALTKSVHTANWVIAYPHLQGLDCNEFLDLAPTYAEVRNYLRPIVIESEKAKLGLAFETIPFCVAGEFLKHVGEFHYSKTNYYCTQVAEETYNWNEVRQRIKSKPQFCAKCAFEGLCEGVWSEYQIYHGSSGLSPIKATPQMKNRISNLIQTMAQ